MARNLLCRSRSDGVSAMKKIAVLAALLGLLVVPAQASVTTYYWHGGEFYPGIGFIGHYTLVDGASPIIANSYDATIDLSGLVDLYVQGYVHGHWLKPVTRADLVASTCLYDPSACSPALPYFWEMQISNSAPWLLYVASGPSYDYVIDSGSIQYYPSAGSGCASSGQTIYYCFSEGEWTTEAVPTPAPATLPLLLGGLLTALGLIRAGRGRIRS